MGSHRDSLSPISTHLHSLEEDPFLLSLCQFRSLPRNVGWHKFYLSMENSLCDDYITEKFFTVLLEHNTVNICPMVLMQMKSKDCNKWTPTHFFDVALCYYVQKKQVLE